MALTFDDLPKAHGFDEIEGLRRTTESMLRTLRTHHAPSVAFVNEDKL
jgi:peptidoglycan/xylan/chitin deacetylase (PgdA/CDA1 family)